MFEFRAFWDKWRLAYDNVYYEGVDGVVLRVLYLGPFVIPE